MVDEFKILETEDPLIGQCIRERFFVERRLDEGGFGAVYLAVDLQLLRRKVVIKVLLETLMEDADARRKFDHEKEALSRLDHSGIVNILGAGTLPDGKPYLVMPYIEGRTLKSIISEKGALPFSFCAKVIENLTEALSATHFKGILHRDVKPSNIILTEQPDGTIRTRLIDFGIARVNDSKISPVTQVEKVQGTIWYMSPEQLQGKVEQSPAVDIFSCAAVFYEMLTGKLPFNPTSVYEMCRLHQEGVKQRVIQLRPEVSLQVDQLILQGLSYAPEERPTDVCAFGKSIASSLLASAGKTDRELGEHLLLTVKLQNLNSLSYENDKIFEDDFLSREAPINSVTDAIDLGDSINGIKSIESSNTSKINYNLPENKNYEAVAQPFLDYSSKSSDTVQKQNKRKLLNFRILISIGIVIWILALFVGAKLFIFFFHDASSDPQSALVSELEPLQSPNPPPSIVTPETNSKPIETPNLLSYYLSVKKASKSGKFVDSFRSTGEGIFFEKNDNIKLVLESAFDGHLYLFLETKDKNGLTEYYYFAYNNGLSFIQANKPLSSTSLVSNGKAGTDKFWLIWSKEKNLELEKAVIKKHDAVISDTKDIDELQKFISNFSNQKVEGLKDNDNKQVILKKSGDVVIHLIELEHR